MKRRWRTAVLAAALLVVISFRLFPQGHSQGLFLSVVKSECSEPEPLHIIWLRANDDGSFEINDRESIARGQLSARLTEIYQLPWEKKILFFDAGDSVSYQQVIAAIDSAQTAVPALRVMLITPTNRRACEHRAPIRLVLGDDRVGRR